jgi:hypothetical protein
MQTIAVVEFGIVLDVLVALSMPFVTMDSRSSSFKVRASLGAVVKKWQAKGNVSKTQHRCY